jgi:Chaperone of endosialidase
LNLVSSGVVGATVGGGGATNFSGQSYTNSVTGNFGTVSGGSGNTASVTATVGGGGGNTASGDDATIGGGSKNTASGASATVAGGGPNNASGDYSTVGGGVGNQATGVGAVIAGGGIILNGVIETTFANFANGAGSTIGGGAGNTVNSNQATVGGGFLNKATNNYATVPGGTGNVAGGQYSFAAGQSAKATNDGAFVWADSQNADFNSTNNDSFNVRAQGGARFLTGGGGMTVDGQAVIISGTPNIIEGSSLNFVSSGVVGATVGGGGATNFSGQSYTNSVTGNFGTVSGGSGNTASVTATVGGGNKNNASTFGATIGGGTGNTASGVNATVAGGGPNNAGGDYSTVGGGSGNQATGVGTVIAGGGIFLNNGLETTLANFANGVGSTVGGGAGNTVSSNQATVGGGFLNKATNNYATVPGGTENVAGGQYSFAAGQQALALNQGAFVWADSQNAAFASSANDQFLVRAQGGVGINTSSTPDSYLCINTNTYLFSHPIYLRGEGGSDHNHGLAYCGPSKTNFLPGVLPDGPVLWGFGGGALGTISASNAVLSWTGNGVTISPGTSSSTPALRVVGIGNATTPALSVSSQNPQLTGLIAQFGNSNAYVAAITNDGTFYGKAFTMTSDRNAKENFMTLDAKTVLEKVAAMPVTQWNYKDDAADKKHIGPVAQDFHTAFGLDGADDKHISVVDEGGVALAAIQGLNQKLNEKDTELTELKERLAALETVVKSLAEKK